MPIAALLARIRKFIPRRDDRHYDEIVRSFGNGALRTPAAPMSDRELAHAIADFLKDSPSAESVGSSTGELIRPRRFEPVVRDSGMLRRDVICRGSHAPGASAPD